jgi:hypothetical protein
VDLDVTGEVFTWRGPSPHHFVRVPAEESAQIEDAAALVTYGWGMVPVTGRIGETTFTTSLWPQDGGYVVPLKLAVRRAEGLEVGDLVTVRLTVDL